MCLIVPRKLFPHFLYICIKSAPVTEQGACTKFVIHLQKKGEVNFCARLQTVIGGDIKDEVVIGVLSFLLGQGLQPHDTYPIARYLHYNLLVDMPGGGIGPCCEDRGVFP